MPKKDDKPKVINTKLGRPRKYKTPEELEEAIDDYFKYCLDNEVPPGVAGMAYHIGFTSRGTIFEHQKRPEFSDTIKRAKLRIEAFYEQALLHAKNQQGVMFALRANFGWEHDPSKGDDEERTIKIEITSPEQKKLIENIGDTD